jgi:hypothetical protein
MNTSELYRILGECTAMFRKGEVITTKRVGVLEVTTVDAMPTVEEGNGRFHCDVFVDVHFVTIGVDSAKAEKHRQAFIDALGPDYGLLERGPSYLHIGAEIGDQGAAFCLMAMGEALGLWRVITPAKLHMEGERAEQAAGLGYIMISGFNRQGEPPDERTTE